MRSVSKICTEHTPTGRIFKPPLQSLAFCTIRLRHCSLLAPFLKQQEIRSICWSAQIISPNGSKLSLWRISEMWMQRSFSGKILSLALGYPTPSSQIMDFSSTANPLEDTVVSWELQTGIPLRHIPKGMDKLKQLTRS